jgi:CRISPR-associated protein Csx10
MSNKIVLELAPQAPAVFSRDASTEGAHATLRAPTGAALLGWAAGKLYESLDEDMAFTIFHSGRVRFSDAVRMLDGEPCFLCPANLFEPKHDQGTVVLGRASYEEANPMKQGEAIKGAWVTPMGTQAPKPSVHHRLRTAMKDGVADEGKLFGYQAVMPGESHYHATIEWDDGVLGEEEIKALKKAFSTTLRIGRASSSGYGGSFACLVLDADSPWPRTPEIDGDAIFFWLLSDAQLIDDWGNSRVDPEPSDFGLPPTWALNKKETSLTTRRIWPWNRTYGHRDMEISVIEVGSVISFERKGQGDPITPIDRIGIGQERGFGRVAVLDAGSFKFAKSESTDNAKPPPEKSSDLTKWAEARAKNRGIVLDPKWTDDRIKEVQSIINRVRDEGPGSTQWSEISGLVDDFASGSENFANKLNEKLNGQGWSAGYGDLANWVRNGLFAIPDDSSAVQQSAAVRQVIKAARAFKPEHAS